jgi:hypothetical protein
MFGREIIKKLGQWLPYYALERDKPCRPYRTETNGRGVVYLQPAGNSSRSKIT